MSLVALNIIVLSAAHSCGFAVRVSQVAHTETQLPATEKGRVSSNSHTQRHQKEEVKTKLICLLCHTNLICVFYL